MSPVIHRRRTVAANAVDRIRERISQIRHTYSVSIDINQFRHDVSENRHGNWKNEKDSEGEVLQEWLDEREIDTLEWIIREILEAVP